MLVHDIVLTLVVDPKELPFFPLKHRELEVRPDTSNNLGSRLPGSCVFAGDDLVLKVTPEHLNLYTAITDCKRHSVDGTSTRYLAGVPFAFDMFQFRSDG